MKRIKTIKHIFNLFYHLWWKEKAIPLMLFGLVKGENGKYKVGISLNRALVHFFNKEEVHKELIKVLEELFDNLQNEKE